MDKMSKTERKRQALSVKDLGEKLVELADEQLGQIELPEEILSAVKLAKTITKHGGRKRQIQYIGVLMRKIDSGPIREAFENLEQGNRKQVEQHQQAELWRDELLRGNDAVQEEILCKLPEAGRGQLSELIAKTREELAKKKPSPAPSRALFRFLYKAAGGSVKGPEPRER